jgi:hypothetical protein
MFHTPHEVRTGRNAGLGRQGPSGTRLPAKAGVPVRGREISALAPAQTPGWPFSAHPRLSKPESSCGPCFCLDSGASWNATPTAATRPRAGFSVTTSSPMAARHRLSNCLATPPGRHSVKRQVRLSFAGAAPCSAGNDDDTSYTPPNALQPVGQPKPTRPPRRKATISRANACRLCRVRPQRG